ncbi:MAG: TonB-dependent receptor, partial [Parabacteroides sp.]|nr:TonB-dependent receptor [Parabacteroides sp.]
MKKEALMLFGLLLSTVSYAGDEGKIDSLINLKGVVVSATKIEVNKNSVPMSVSVIDRNEIEASSESALLPVLSQR